MDSVPLNLIGKPGNGFVNLSWVNDDPDVVSYNVYRSNSPIFDSLLENVTSDQGQLTSATISNNSSKIDIDSNNKIHLVYRDLVGNIIYKNKDYNTNLFSSEIRVSISSLTPTPIAYYPSIAVGSNNKIHIVWAWNVQNKYDIYYTNNNTNDGSFITPVKVSGGSVYATLPSLSLDSNNNVYIAYHDVKDNTFSDVYVVRIYNNILEVPVKISNNGLARNKTVSIIVDNQNVAHVVWILDNGSEQTLYYSHNTNGTFIIPVQLFITLTKVRTPCIKVDSQNNLHLVFVNEVSNNNTNVIYSADTGGGFAISTVMSQETSISQLPVVAIDNSDNVHIMWEDFFVDMTSARVFYRNNIGGSFGNYSILSNISERTKGISSVFLNDEMVCTWTEYNKNIIPSYSVVLYRKIIILNTDADLTLLNLTPITEKTYTDLDVENGRYYYYVATNVFYDSSESLFSDQTLAAPRASDIFAPNIPTNLMATLEGNGVRLVWDKITEPDFGGFDVYRKSTLVNIYNKISYGQVANEFFDDHERTKDIDNNVIYTYSIKSLDKATPPNESPYSNEVNVTFIKREIPNINVPFILYGKVYPMQDSDLSAIEVTVRDKFNNTYSETLQDVVYGYYLINAGNLPSQWSKGDLITLTAIDLETGGQDSIDILLQESPQEIVDLQISMQSLGENVAVEIREGSLVNNRYITLDFFAVNATEMIVSENSRFTGASYEPYVNTKTFLLSAGDGLKTVYVRYRDVFKNISNIVSDSTTLDTTAPDVNFYIVEPSPVVNREITLRFTGSAYQTLVSEDANFTNVVWEAFVGESKFTLSEEPGAKIIYAKFRDNALNETGIYLQRTTYIVLPVAPTVINPLGTVSNLPEFTFRLNETQRYRVVYSIELSRNNFRTIEKTINQIDDPYGWVAPDGGIAYDYATTDTAIYQLPIEDELKIGSWQFRSRAKNDFGYGSYSEIIDVHVGIHDGSYQGTYPVYKIRYATTFTSHDYWDFFLMVQERALVYWTDGEIYLNEGVYVIRGSDDSPVDPASYPVLDFEITPNYEWWMVIQWRPDITYFGLSNGSIKFIDSDKLEDLWLIEKDWIPVLFFPSGTSNKVAAVGSSLVAYSDNNYSINSLTYINDFILRDHINNVSIHEGARLALPFIGVGETTEDNPIMLTVNNLTEDIINSRGIVAKSKGIGMAGISSVQSFAGHGLTGVGIYAQGDYVDVLMKNGKLDSKIGIVNIGEDEEPMSVAVNMGSEEEDGVVAENISEVISGDLSSYELPIGIKSVVTGQNAIGSIGRSQFIGVKAEGYEADIYLKHGVIKTKDDRGNLVVNDHIINKYALLK